MLELVSELDHPRFSDAHWDGTLGLQLVVIGDGAFHGGSLLVNLRLIDPH